MGVIKIVLLQVLLLAQMAAGAPSMVKTKCKDRCGHILIPYPFGMGSKHCYNDDWFKVECRDGKAYLSRLRLEILGNVSVGVKDKVDSVSVKGPIFKSSRNCSGNTNPTPSLNLTGTPFYFSSGNTFTAVGHTAAFIAEDSSYEIVGCRARGGGNEDWRKILSNLNFTQEHWNPCNGTYCCHTSAHDFGRVLKPDFQPTGGEIGNCNMAFLAEDDWLLGPEMHKIETLEYVKMDLGWEMEMSSLDNKTTYCDKGIYSLLVTDCWCNEGYEGNPYLGCTDIDECQNGNCTGITKCVNTDGSYKCVGNSLLITTIALGGAIGVIAFLFGIWLAYKMIKRRRDKQLKLKFFRRNGGSLLQQQVISVNDSVQKTKIFKSKELETATDHFSPNRILGQGGQGTVYKGMLVNGQIVAVKKSTVVDEEKVQEFINEVVILSQINHRNVVKLLGCCLETQVPLLVYEFIPNGSLYQYLHHQSTEDVPLSWEMRLQIAVEAAGAIAYLHSAAEIPIYHRDIKSNNILLDGKFRAKVSDFGISRSIAVDQTHLTTHVQGTFGYMDPDTFQSGQYTEKSDVYSYGVVLAELVSGRKPIFSGEDEERIGLASYFRTSMEEKKLGEIIDHTIMQHRHEEQIAEVANLAWRCLHLSGRLRPTMKEVATKLEQIRPSSSAQESIEMNAVPTLMRSDFSNLSSQSDEDVPSVS